MSYFQSLHSHTTKSDGKLSPIELLDTAQKNNIGVVAFTDHDSLMDEKVIKEINNHNVKWVSGIEMSSGLPTEMGPNSNGPHIVGLFVDATNVDLQNYCKKAQKERIEIMERRAENLTAIGFKISVQDCLKASNGEAVGRPHIVTALSMHPENGAIMNSLVKKMARAAKSDSEINKKYLTMIAAGQRQYPYVLFLSDDAFLKDINGERGYWADFDECVALIRNAGGVAIFAHYSTERKKISLIKLDELLKENRIDGAETVYGLYEFNTPAEQDTLNDREVIRQLLNKNRKLISGGADIHTSQDVEKFSSYVVYASETIGMAEELIKNSKVDTTWSSFHK